MCNTFKLKFSYGCNFSKELSQTFTNLRTLFQDDSIVSYLVDPASSHMLVSKIKPCMSKYKLLYGETADGSLKQLWFTWWFPCYMDNRSNSRANTCRKARSFGSGLLDQSQTPFGVPLVNHSNLSDRMALRRRHFIQISALSVFDGTVLAYRGIDG